MNVATIYHPRTGRVIGVRRCSGPIPPADPRGNVAYIAGDYSRGFYIDPEDGTPKPKKELAVEVDGNTLAGLPDGCTVRTQGEVLEWAARGELGILVDYEEEVRLSIDHPHFHRADVRIKCAPGGKVPAKAARKVRLRQDAEELRKRALPSAEAILEAHARGDDAAMAAFREQYAEADRKFRKVARSGK